MNVVPRVNVAPRMIVAPNVNVVPRTIVALRAIAAPEGKYYFTDEYCPKPEGRALG